MLDPRPLLDWFVLRKGKDWCRGSETVSFSCGSRRTHCSYEVLGKASSNLHLSRWGPTPLLLTHLGPGNIFYSVPEANSSFGRRKKRMPAILKACRAILDHFVLLLQNGRSGWFIKSRCWFLVVLEHRQPKTWGSCLSAASAYTACYPAAEGRSMKERLRWNLAW